MKVRSKRRGAHPRRLRAILSAIGLTVTMIELGSLVGSASGQEFVPFVIPACINAERAIWMADYEPIRVDSPRLTVESGRFYRGDHRVRIWGVNLSFGANFPTHADAPDVAARLAAAGVNSVRCHHMDTSRWPRGLWNAAHGRTIEPEALDRLDYFINELAQRRICVNINLHVGREHSEYVGLPETNRSYDKISGIFTPALVEAQKTFARDLLTHVNRYRGLRYADDPAVAFVEITNEDSFFMWSSEETLRTLPRYYSRVLWDLFNGWLQQRYGSDDALRAAWSQGTRPLGQDLLENGDFQRRDRGQTTPTAWNLEQHESCRATLSPWVYQDKPALRVDVGRADDTNWHLQLTQGGFSLEQGQYYTLTFDAAAANPRSIQCGVSQAHSPWDNLGLSQQVNLTSSWQSFRFGFAGRADDTNARVSFAFSGNDTTFYLTNVALHPGGQVALVAGESLSKGNISLFQTNESRPRILDRMIFLAETEKAYFDDMRSYIRDGLGCQALVTGTIVFGPLGLYAQSGMDFIDTHAYWQHPRFPGQPWDAGNWTIEQRPMTDHPDEATLFGLAAKRLDGKPFTCSEYNHPAPLDAQAECVPMMAAFAAAQDWDGLWFYTYSHSGDSWDRQYLGSYFDIDTNPGKWGFMRAGAAIFRQERLTPLASARMIEVCNLPDELAQLAAIHLQHDQDMLDVLADAGQVRYEDMLRSRILPNYGGPVPATAGQGVPVTDLEWSVDESGKGLFQAVSPQAQVYTGHAGRFDDATNGSIRITAPEFVAVTLTPLDDKGWVPLDTAERILVTACGRCENTAMQFSPDRRTVGRNWGGGPVRIEAVEGRIVLYRGAWTCHALASNGAKTQPVPVLPDGRDSVLELSTDYETMWYLLERQKR